MLGLKFRKKFTEALKSEEISEQLKRASDIINPSEIILITVAKQMDIKQKCQRTSLPNVSNIPRYDKECTCLKPQDY